MPFRKQKPAQPPRRPPAALQGCVLGDAPYSSISTRKKGRRKMTLTLNGMYRPLQLGEARQGREHLVTWEDTAATPAFVVGVFFFFFLLFRPHLRHMEVPGLEVKLELQLPVYTTATATWDLSFVCDLHHSSQQGRIPDPLSKARDQTLILMDTSQIHFPSAMTGTPVFFLIGGTPAAYGNSQAGVKSELQLPAYTTATATPDP